MLVVLEGCDGSGKSTLASNLQKILGARIVHCTKDTPNTYEFFDDIIRASYATNIIADRFCFGQFVYQSSAERQLTRDELTKLELNMIEAGAKVIHVTASVQEIKQRLNRRREDTEKSVEDITQAYLDLFDTTLEKPSLWWTGAEY